MANCNKCMFYSSEYDKLRASYNDLAEDIAKNTCAVYDKGIDASIFNTDKPCEYYTEESE